MDVFGYCLNTSIELKWLNLSLNHPYFSCPETNEEALLKQALDMSMQPDDAAVSSATPATGGSSAMPDFAMMSEEDQIAYAMQLSMAPDDQTTTSSSANTPAAAPMETDEAEAEKAKEEGGEEEQEVSSQPLKRRKLCQVLWLGATQQSGGPTWHCAGFTQR